jgi:hypothetical protein
MVGLEMIPVKRTGKIKISQMDVPFAPCIEEIPRRAISEDVSKPSPTLTQGG